MKLAAFLKDQSLTPSAFAAQVGVPPSTITRLVRGERLARLDTIQRITAVTNGAVTADDFLPAPASESAA